MANNRKEKRKRRVRSKIRGTKKRPRLNVFRSNKSIYAQLIDDQKGRTLVSFSSKDLTKKKSEKKSKTEISKLVGEELAKKAKKKKIKEAVFDRGPYRFHGRVKALAEGAKEGGLKF